MMDQHHRCGRGGGGGDGCERVEVYFRQENDKTTIIREKKSCQGKK